MTHGVAQTQTKNKKQKTDEKLDSKSSLQLSVEPIILIQSRFHTYNICNQTVWYI